jgi:hypothetical protein
MRLNNCLGLRHAAACVALLFAAWSGAQAATIVIINNNAPGVGFNDPTPATPVGGNTGTTLGAQRLIAFTHAANIWGAKLTSAVPIRVRASFEPLPCTEFSAVLGSAGAIEIFANFPGAPRSNAWYPGALAAKLAGTDVTEPENEHIRARFNSRLGLAADCFPGTTFYLGLDNQHGPNIDFVTVLLHEMAHGLGFQNFTDEETGEEILDTPSIWDYFLVDSRNNKTWVNMTNEERRLSAISDEALAWNGPRVTTATQYVLGPQPDLAIRGQHAGLAFGRYRVGSASFGPQLGEPGVRGELMPVVDQPNGTGLACTPLSPANAAAVRGNIALVYRGQCPFVTKALIVQNAGAKGMVVIDNVQGPLTGLGGDSDAVTIPAVRVTLETGTVLAGVLNERSRTASGVTATLGIDPDRLAGTDTRRRIRMYSPTSYEPGSSVSHYTPDAAPNQLMEPSLNGDLPHQVDRPRDLTLPLLRDIGW